MRILILLSRIPYPLEKGDKLRAFYQVKELSKSNEIILCALNPMKNIDKQKAFATLQPYCRSVNFVNLPYTARLWNVFLAFFKGLPLQVGYFYNSFAFRKIKKLINDYQPDHIYCQLLRTAEYVKDSSLPKTLDYQDVFSYGVKRRYRNASLWFKPFLKLEYHRLLRYEEKIFELFDNKTIISEPDRKLMPHRNRQKIVIVRNGVDFEFFKPDKTKTIYDIVFTGNMHYPPNVDAARFLVVDIMPKVWRNSPATKLLLAGASPDVSVKALACEKVEVSGWIDDIREAYSSSVIFIAPMRIGTGLQNKLLEAMAMNVPSITTPLANEALNATSGKEILVGESAGELSELILKLLKNPGFQQDIAKNARAFVVKNFSWSEATAPLNALIKQTTPQAKH